MFSERDAYELVTTAAGERVATLRRDLALGHIERAAGTALELAGQTYLIRDGGLGPLPNEAVLWDLEGALDAALGLPRQRLFADVSRDVAAAEAHALTFDAGVDRQADNDSRLAFYGAATVDIDLSDVCDLVAERAIEVAAALIAVLVDDPTPSS